MEVEGILKRAWKEFRINLTKYVLSIDVFVFQVEVSIDKSESVFQSNHYQTNDGRLQAGRLS